MGREANCICQIGTESSESKVMLESTELIVRGPLRRTIALSELKEVHVDGDMLAFKVKRDSISLKLGAKVAKIWLSAIQKPPVTLAHKLGIKSDTIVRTIGEASSNEMKSALREAAEIRDRAPDLIVVTAESTASLADAINATKAQLHSGIPIWIVYRKGTGTELGESKVREVLLQQGLKDSKVASVSSTFTALRFSKPSRP